MYNLLVFGLIDTLSYVQLVRQSASNYHLVVFDLVDACLYVQLDLLCFNVVYLHGLNGLLICLLLFTWISLSVMVKVYLVTGPRVANVQSQVRQCTNETLKQKKQNNI